MGDRGGALFLGHPVVRQYLLALRALADRDDGVAEAALLRPPFFAIDCADTVAALANKNDADPRRARVRAARDVITALRTQRHAQSPGATARDLIERTSLGRAVITSHNGRQTLAALYELARQACPLPLTMTTIHELAAFYQPPDTPWIGQLSGWSGMEAATVPFGTNATAYSGLAREVVIFGPGSIDQAHRDVEWVDVSQLEKAAGIYARWWESV